MLPPAGTGNPFSPASFTKALHASMDGALATIPGGHTHALLFDGTYDHTDGPAIRAVYMQKAPDGWNMVMAAGYDGPHGVNGQVELSKSW